MSIAELLANRENKYGWVTDIEAETIPRGYRESWGTWRRAPHKVQSRAGKLLPPPEACCLCRERDQATTPIQRELPERRLAPSYLGLLAVLEVVAVGSFGSQPVHLRKCGVV